MPNTVIRFLPLSSRPGGLFTASLILVLISSLIGSVIAILLTVTPFTKLAFIHSSVASSLLLFLLITCTSIGTVLDGVLVSFRRGEYILRKALITNLPRVFLPFFVVVYGVTGIISIYVFTISIGIVYNMIVILRRLLASARLRPDLTELARHRSYAASNYFGGMFGVLPSTVVPLIILSVLGASAAAYFYMPVMIGLFLNVISGSVSLSLISECSQSNDVEQHRLFFWRAAKHQYLLLVPAVLVLLVVGWPILRIYGKSYADNGYVPLSVLAASSLIVGISWLGDTWLNIQKRSRDYFMMNAFNALVVVGLVSLFAFHGLVAAALGYLCGQVVSAVVYLAIFARSRLLVFRR